MRGVAAVCVMITHLGEVHGRAWCTNSALAVDFFFVLSGFVIAHSYGRRLLDGSLGSWEYLGKRLARLYPMFLLGMAIGAPVLFWQQQAGNLKSSATFVGLSVLLNFFYLPIFHAHNLGTTTTTGVLFPSNPPAWSLFFEVIASASFLWLVRLNLRALTALMAVSFMALLGYGIGHALWQHRHAIDLELGWATDNFIGGFPRVLYGFTVGMLIYRLRDTPHFQSLRSRWPFRGDISYLLYVTLVALLIFPKLFWGLYPAVVIALLAPAMVILGCGVNCTSGASAHIAQFLGWISYPLYCLHCPIVILIALLMPISHYTLVFVVTVSVIVTLAAAVVLTLVIEEPARAYLGRKLSARAARRGLTKPA